MKPRSVLYWAIVSTSFPAIHIGNLHANHRAASERCNYLNKLNPGFSWIVVRVEIRQVAKKAHGAAPGVNTRASAVSVESGRAAPGKRPPVEAPPHTARPSTRGNSRSNCTSEKKTPRVSAHRREGNTGIRGGVSR